MTNNPTPLTIQFMSSHYFNPYYPAGSDTPDAPWNAVEDDTDELHICEECGGDFEDELIEGMYCEACDKKLEDEDNAKV